VYLFAWQIFRDRQMLRAGQEKLRAGHEKQRAMAEELAGWNERLRREVDARTADLQRLARRLEEVHEDERRRLAHELHDELGQSLTALRLEVAVLGRHGLSREQRRALDARLDELLESVQWTVSSLRPKALEEQGLAPACEWLLARFAAQTGLDVESSIDAHAAPSAETSLAVFRVLQEALTNVGKHAEASGVSIALVREGDEIVLSVTDDGAGFEPSEAPRARGGHGLLGMRERALAIGGSVEIEGRHVGADGQPAGTRVVLRVPVRGEREGKAEA
jgi:signal transduction histidine kinase